MGDGRVGVCVMKAYVVFLALSASALVLLPTQPASAQFKRSQLDCEYPVLVGGRWLPVNCHSDPEEALAASVELDDPREPPWHDHDGKPCRMKHQFFEHFHDGLRDVLRHDRNSMETRSASLSTSSGSGGGGGGGGVGSVAESVSDAVGGLLGN